MSAHGAHKGEQIMANVAGDWDIIQSNGFTVHVHLTQDGDRLFGSASVGASAAEVTEESRIDGNACLIVLRWEPAGGSVGEYHGFIGVNRRLTGVTFDRAHPGSQASWFSDKFFP